MDPVILTLIILGVFLLLAFLGMPLWFSFLTAGFLGFVLVRGLSAALALLGSVAFSQASVFLLVVIPLFVLMGQFAFHSGISTDLFAAGYKWIGGRPGGLALATTLACTGFAACTGSSLASAATMGIVALPEMKKYNYSARLSTGCVAAGGTLGILIPPSTIFIIYGFITQTSIGALFIAGIFPGMLLASLFMIMIYLRCWRNPQLGPRGPSFPWRERFASLRGVWGMLVLFLLVIGGIYLGIFTPTEAGSIGAFGAFLITIIRRRMTWTVFIDSLKGTVQTTSMIFFLLIGVTVLNVFMGTVMVPMMLSRWISSLGLSPYVILAIILLMYVPLGMVIDSLPMILLTLPTIYPIVTNLGFDMVWFGVLVVIMCTMANITPPVGMNLFIIRGVAKDVPLREIILGAVPFVLVMVVSLVILVAFPQISLFLPGLMK